MPTSARSIVILLVCLLVAACGGGAGGGLEAPPGGVLFVVKDGANHAVTGARVYLVPATWVDETPIIGSTVLNGSSELHDEPLEDLVRQRGTEMISVLTNAKGHATIDAPPLGAYYFFVEPAAQDDERIPGGSGTRKAREAASFVETVIDLRVSTRPSDAAHTVGSTLCLACHGSLSGINGHAHRTGITLPGTIASNQDPSRYPGIAAGWALFPSAATFSGGTPIWCFDYDPGRDPDQFKTSTSDPSGSGGVVAIRAWLWIDSGDGLYKITLENLATPADPARTYEVAMGIGGALSELLFHVRVPNRSGFYPLFQWQIEGDEADFDRTRKSFRDFGLASFWQAGPDLLGDPPLDASFQARCSACHSTGFERVQDPGNNEWLAKATEDPQALVDLNGDGVEDEVNVGCEACHGPGSEHVAWASNSQNQGHAARYIVQPRNLSPSRELTLCGRCHDRYIGLGSTGSGEPLDVSNAFPRAGVSRQDLLASYTAQKGPAVSDFWLGEVHSRRSQQHAADFLKSSKYRNARQLVVCSDCHDSHGNTPHVHHLVADPSDANSPLCSRCHAQDLTTHMFQNTGSTHAGNLTSCVDCHMPPTGKGGAGRQGALLGTPTGGPGDADLVYHENDRASHLFQRVPRKTNPATAGKAPIDAMPIPYTMSCGVGCHDASNIPQLIPFLTLPSAAAAEVGTPTQHSQPRNR